MFYPTPKMKCFLPEAPDATANYAVAELKRLLAKLGTILEPEAETLPENRIALGERFETRPREVSSDGFEIDVRSGGVALSGRNSKGLLNSVYEFVELLGVRFLFPGENGERIPEKSCGVSEGVIRKNPVFPRRGLFLAQQMYGNSMDDRVRFLAKLRCNAVCFHGNITSSDELCAELGLRKEVGGHGFSSLLDRTLFETHPEYFRMLQPEDFRGKRMPDSNLCVTNPAVRELVTANFSKQAEKNRTLYALHAWADDLPGGGWCCCPSCRSFSPADQNMLGMRLLCRGAERAGSALRIPVIAYHDTLFPGEAVPADPRMFLLWAPRERCYAHAIDDPACPRNRIHWEALGKWMEKFHGISDPHTFEYYLDALLFNGLYPFTPEIIRRDTIAYRKIGMESFMTLQVASCDVMPEYNLLFFAKSNWDANLDTDRFLNWLTPDENFRQFLREYASVFEDSLAMCGHDMRIYMDYRFLPESGTAFSHRMAEVYGKASKRMAEAGNRLLGSPGREQEYRRAVFESAQLRSMSLQQRAMNEFARYQIENDLSARRRGCDYLRENLISVNDAERKLDAVGYSPDCWHKTKRIPWERHEIEEKLQKYGDFS